MSSRPSSVIRPVGGRTMTRRAALRTFAGAGLAVIAAAGVGQSAFAQNVVGEAITTANLNLRSGPGTTHSILLVIPKGSRVTLYDRGSAAFLMVKYQGTTGYASAEYLAPADSSPPEYPNTGIAKTTANVNLRSGPSTGHQILRVVPAGSQVNTTGGMQNGFRYVTHNGLAGWMSNQYLTWDLGQNPTPSGETFTTTANLRLRAQPNTSSQILLVMPVGSVVKAMEGRADGFRQVSYKGTVGWAATPYLN